MKIPVAKWMGVGLTYWMSVLVVTVAVNNGQATLIHHWALDEMNLTDLNNSTYGGIVDSTGNSTDAVLFGYAAGKDLAALGVVGVAGPPGFGTAYNFTEVPGESAGISGVFTNSFDALPATGDFTLQIVMNTTSMVNNSNIFSNNNGQTNRAGFQTDASGKLFWFLNGGVNINGSTVVADGEWHTVGIAREGTRFDVFADGVIVGTGTSAAPISTAQSWMIGRQRSSAGGFDGIVADVKIFDAYVIPEPSSMALGGLVAIACMVVKRPRRKAQSIR